MKSYQSSHGLHVLRKENNQMFTQFNQARLFGNAKNELDLDHLKQTSYTTVLSKE